MNIQLSLFTAIIIVVIIHTILTHFINWMWRECYDEDGGPSFSIFVTVVEIVLLSSTIHYITSQTSQ